MDGDIFGAVSRLGRGAAEALLDTLRGEPFDPFLPARCLERMFNLAGGIPSLPPVLDQFRALQTTSLPLPVMNGLALDEVERVVHAAKGTVLDRILLRVAQRNLLKRDFDPISLVRSMLVEMLDRAIITARGGLLDLEGGGAQRRDEARCLLASVVDEEAKELARRPDAQRVSFSKKYARIDATTNLLGGDYAKRS